MVLEGHNQLGPEHRAGVPPSFPSLKIELLPASGATGGCGERLWQAYRGGSP